MTYLLLVLTCFIITGDMLFTSDSTDNTRGSVPTGPQEEQATEDCVDHGLFLYGGPDFFFEKYTLIATYVLQYSSDCKTCPSQVSEICADKKEIF